ncbi:MAG: trehalose-phosphatase, partial [Candidatus Hydrogenedentes bacterium]|nr:trehalose-phosphatase [Candidatus Hydrogenedentota bacterium]
MKKRSEADDPPSVRVAGVPVQAAILDLDGVITQTAKIHARAWKKMFDEYLQRRSKKSNEKLQPFSIEQDYYAYVDGKPRYEGARSFLEARGIELDYGNPDDPPGRETYCGLGNRKNELFRATIDEEGVDAYEDAIEAIKKWRSAGLKTAVASSSKNCALIVRAAGLEDQFDATMEGQEAEKEDIPGKPEPDYFTRAAAKLGVSPKRAFIVKDAIAGVEAGRAGNFGLVVGVARSETAEPLEQHGADVVVGKLTELQMELANTRDMRPPSALRQFDAIAKAFHRRNLAIFLDYDGTLTPIVQDPAQAFMPKDMRETVQKLAHLTTVAIISGRDRPVVERFVQIDGLIYAGSHGFDIRGPDIRREHEGGVAALDSLDQAEQELQERLRQVHGALVERKKSALAIHYRNVSKTDTDTVTHAVEEEHKKHPQLRGRSGKKVLELLPMWNGTKAEHCYGYLTFSDSIFAVGMALAGHPPHRSRRAELPHRAPASG